MLGDTIRVSPSKAGGSWSIQSSDFSLNLSERADVAISGGLLLGASWPARLTLTLRPRGRGESLAALRRELVPFCRPEAGGLTLSYTGALRTLMLPCRYVEGLERLELTLEAKAATWRSFDPDTTTGMIEHNLTLNTPYLFTPVGTAGSPPFFWITYGSGGALWQIVNNVAGVYDLVYTLSFADDSPPSGTQAEISCAEVTAIPAVLFHALLPGSTFGAFRLVGGVENVLTITGGNLTLVRVGYYPRWWSWEDADV